MSFRTRAVIVVGLSDFTLTLHKPDEGEKKWTGPKQKQQQKKKKKCDSRFLREGPEERRGAGPGLHVDLCAKLTPNNQPFEIILCHTHTHTHAGSDMRPFVSRLSKDDL